MAYYMGIDMGGTMVKAAIFDGEGQEAAVHGERLTLLHPGKDMNERSMEEAERMTCSAIKKAIEESGIAPEEIRGIGLTGQANGLYLLDEQGGSVRNAVLSGDERAKDYIKKWYGDGTFDFLLPKIQQRIWAGNVPALLAWFQDYEPEALERARYALTAKEYMRYLLTGQVGIEITEAAGIACLDREINRFTPEVFRAYGIETYLDRLPSRIIGCSEVGGVVTQTFAEKSGLAPGTPVVGGQIDSGASILAAGVTDESKMGVIVGTWGINGFITKTPIVSPDVFMTFYYGIPGYIEAIEGSSTSATNLEWFIERYMDRSEVKNIYALCDGLVKQAAYQDTVLFLPFLYGTNAGLDAQSAFVGLKGRHGRGEMLRAIYEGVVFCHMQHIDRLLRFTNMPPAVRMAGGATRSPVWMQLFADILGVRVEVSAASELGAMGVAMHAAVGAGDFRDVTEVASKWTNRLRAVYEPDPERHAYYKGKYAAYQALIEQLEPLWEDISHLVL